MGYSFLNNYVDYTVSGSVTDADAAQSLVVMAVTDNDAPGGGIHARRSLALVAGPGCRDRGGSSRCTGTLQVPWGTSVEANGSLVIAAFSPSRSRNGLL